MTPATGQMVLVGIADLRTSRDPAQVLVARSIGSGAALAIYDPHRGIGGMLHWMLPDSRTDRDRARRAPGLFADSGLARLLAEMSVSSTDHLRAAVAGASSLPEGGDYDVGARNRAAAAKLLAKAGIRIESEDTGGMVVRELALEIGSGRFRVQVLR